MRAGGREGWKEGKRRPNDMTKGYSITGKSMMLKRKTWV